MFVKSTVVVFEKYTIISLSLYAVLVENPSAGNIIHVLLFYWEMVPDKWFLATIFPCLSIAER